MADYDYVIVGAGSAGCVLAYRLSADPATRVLLIEAGGAARDPLIQMPKGIARVMRNPRLTWPFATQPELASNDGPEAWTRGRVLGGSSAINGMMYVRGLAADYDALATLTSNDWSWSQIGASYKALESHELGAAATRGDSGPLRISMPTRRTALTEAIAAAGGAMGLQRLEDFNDPSDMERVGYAPRTIHRGHRQSAARAFLDPVRSLPNLTILTGAVVDRIGFHGKRAASVRLTRGGKTEEYRAAREILLAAGALATPAILQRSGIGSAAALAAHGIPLLRDCPDVGANLCEHRGLVMQWRVRDSLSDNRNYRGLGLARSMLAYMLGRRGPMAEAAFDLGAWVRSRRDVDRPDGQLLMGTYSFDYGSRKPRVEGQGGMIFCVYPLRPQSRGSLTIRSDRADDLPLISPGYATDPADAETLIALIRYARRYVAQPPLAPHVIEETRPGSRYQDDEELIEAHRQMGYTNYHACGTCRMGKDTRSVVDPRLRVRGVDSLRVADTSVFPFMLAGNTQAPAMAIAWRAADLIRQDAR